MPARAPRCAGVCVVAGRWFSDIDAAPQHFRRELARQAAYFQ